jgi:hypothetical protein
MGVDRILCLAGEAKGQEFLRECARLDVRPTLLTLDSLRGCAWPQESLEELASMPAGLNLEQILNTVSWMARGRSYHRVVALDAGWLLLAAQLREHMRVPGMGVTTAGFYRDKLAMRICAQEAGFTVPAFCRVLHYDDLRLFMEELPAPWLLEPRYGREGMVRRIENAEQLWRSLDDLGDAQSRHILSQMIPGVSFHVESILSERTVLFSQVSRYGRARQEQLLAGGLQSSLLCPRDSRDWMELTALNAGLTPALGMARGVVHAEYLRSRVDGRYFFTELAAPVCGPWEVEEVEAASGVNLWREWARLEAAHLRGGHYLPPESFEHYAASISGGGSALEGTLAALEDASIAARSGDGLLLRAGTPEAAEGLLGEIWWAAEAAQAG